MTDRPEGMFTDARLLAGRNHIDGNLSVVTCTLCGSLVADTDAHHQMHFPPPTVREQRNTWITDD